LKTDEKKSKLEAKSGNPRPIRKVESMTVEPSIGLNIRGEDLSKLKVNHTEDAEGVSRYKKQ
jgi:hypothetical protein